MRSKTITIFIVISAILLAITSCSEWDTFTAGTKFAPANSQVRIFKRQVYVEYGPHSANIWGEAADLVESDVDDCHVRLRFDKDSIAIIVYGYTTADTTQIGGDASLTIHANTKTGYALYLNGTSIYNPHGPAIQSLGSNPCFVVVPANTKNALTTTEMDNAENNANACLYIEGPLQISGTGSLNVCNLSRNASRSNAICAASMGCSYDLKANIRSVAGNAILAYNIINISSGKWEMSSELSNIKAQAVQLTSGSFNAHCQKGSFIETFDVYTVPALLRNPTITSLAPRYTNFADSAFMASLGHVADSLYYPKQYMPDFEFQKDSIYTIYYFRDSIENKLTTFSSPVSMNEGYLLISNPKLNNQDHIFVTK